MFIYQGKVSASCGRWNFAYIRVNKDLSISSFSNTKAIAFDDRCSKNRTVRSDTSNESLIDLQEIWFMVIIRIWFSDSSTRWKVGLSAIYRLCSFMSLKYVCRPLERFSKLWRQGKIVTRRDFEESRQENTKKCHPFKEVVTWSGAIRLKNFLSKIFMGRSDRTNVLLIRFDPCRFSRRKSDKWENASHGLSRFI